LDNETLIQQFAAYLRRRFPDRSTAKHYISDLRQFSAMCTKPWTAVTCADIDAFVDQQRQAGRASATVKRRVAALKTFFDFLAETLGEPQRPNPVSMRRHAGRQPRRLPRDLSDAEVERLLAVVDQSRDRAMVNLMLYAGLRVGEVAALRPVDLTVPQDPEAPVRLRVLGKGRKERVAYLCRSQYRPLAQYLQEQSAADRETPLFRNWFGQPITVAGIQNRLGYYAQRSGVDVTCHRLRHTYGRWLAESEVPILALARLLGHRSIQTTQRYIDGADPKLRRHYEAAMTSVMAAETKQLRPSPASPPTEVVPEPATVVREPPPPFAEPNWLGDWPTWLQEGCRDWMRHKWYTWKPSRRKRLAHTRWVTLRLFWRWQLVRRTWHDWADLTTADMAAFVEAQLARGLKVSTVTSYLGCIYQLLRYLHDRDQLAQLPERPAIARPDPLPRHLTPQEVVALETYVQQRQREADAADWLVIALYYLLAHAGLRISEALDLQVQDLDLTARRVRVREGKGQRDRVVFLTTTAAAALRCYLATVPHAAEDLVLSWRQQPLSYVQAYRRLQCLGQAIGMEQLSAHRLRHTYATLLLNNGMTIESLRQLMGHENLNTTLVYARLADSTVEKQYETAMERITNNQVNSM
jgi:site-specific recombinase XerD